MATCFSSARLKTSSCMVRKVVYGARRSSLAHLVDDHHSGGAKMQCGDFLVALETLKRLMIPERFLVE
ncbi:hypothetical protein WN944_027802 [Citrus x changshan-huyou]|uniref:Uncharacterized protein n=1 Tax=Citrus x changshan-huyou TaxID=2935761 RepID=A0AAP0LI72_9ROSI